MSESKAEYYLHFVWTTKQRHPLLTLDVEAGAYRCMQAEAQRLRCVVLALGGMPDRVHLAVKAPTALSPAMVMKQIKGVSSKFIGDEFAHRESHALDWFRWQEGYGVFTFSASQKPRIIRYIQDQKQRHSEGSLWSACETDN